MDWWGEEGAVDGGCGLEDGTERLVRIFTWISWGKGYRAIGLMKNDSPREGRWGKANCQLAYRGIERSL